MGLTTVQRYCTACDQSFLHATFPAVHKEGLVTPLLKKPGHDTSDLDLSPNYQPFHYIKNNGTFGIVKAQIPPSQFT